MLQDKRIFTFIHLVQDKGLQLDRAAIVIYTNPFLTQQEQESITSLTENIKAISTA